MAFDILLARRSTLTSSDGGDGGENCLSEDILQLVHRTCRDLGGERERLEFP